MRSENHEQTNPQFKSSDWELQILLVSVASKQRQGQKDWEGRERGLWIKMAIRKRQEYCTSCVKNPKPLTECLACTDLVRLRRNAYYRKNRRLDPVRNAERKKRWYQKNRESILKQDRVYAKKYHWKNRESILAKQRARRKENREKLNAMSRRSRFKKKYKNEDLIKTAELLAQITIKRRAYACEQKKVSHK